MDPRFSSWVAASIKRWAPAYGVTIAPSLVFGIKHPMALSFQYIAVFGAAGLGLYAISHAAIIEPPAFMVNAVSAITERLTRRFATT